MSITVKPTHPDFVTEISGVDLARPPTPADRDAIEDAINRYAIVVFHDQTLTDEQHATTRSCCRSRTSSRSTSPVISGRSIRRRRRRGTPA